MEPECINLKQCHAVGLSILDYSKAHMYELFYEKIGPLLVLDLARGEVKVIMSDTDSFLLSLSMPDSLVEVYQKIEQYNGFQQLPF